MALFRLPRHKISFSKQLSLVFWLCALLLAIELVNGFSGRALNQFGILPRHESGLIGVLAAPFLHGSYWHFASNIVPFALFSLLLLQHGYRRYIYISLMGIVVSGLLTWQFGRAAIHVGASGVIYCYFGYLLLAGWLSREFKLLFISLLVGFFYGGLVLGVLPLNTDIAGQQVSWEGHLFGFLTGLGCAFLWAGSKR